MFTSSWSAYKGSGRVGISRGLPRGAPAGYKRYAPLQPGEWLWTTDDEATYRDLYFAQLNALDPARVVADLYRLAGTATPVLCCFCSLNKPSKPGEPAPYCHRRMVAEWLEASTGTVVPEMSAAEVRTIRRTEHLSLGV